ncbi:MAG: allantoicase [Robiginitomaculum sp.]|nr:MAG: allantoicase [Robiginitomaculum sp.]
MTPDFAKENIDLAQPRLGSKVTYATDDFFADKARLINPEVPIFIEGKYDDNGKWMDGWESRRKRVPGHDHCIIRLGRPGVISGFLVDTAHFTGNYPPFASLEACTSKTDIPDEADWREVVPKMALKGDSQHYVIVEEADTFTHVRLHIYPDGGVARLRIYGTIHKDWTQVSAGTLINLAALEEGARPLGCNDQHFGTPENMLAPTKGINMGDGWETRRRREPGHDWAVIALAHPGVIEKAVIDTAFFKGNYPDRTFLQAALITGKTDAEILAEAENWPVLLSEQKLAADTVHEFTDALNALGPVSHVRLNIIPDGGVSRLRLWGRLA